MAPVRVRTETYAPHATREITMASSSAPTPEHYIDELPPDRAEVVSRVRDVIRANLPRGYQESMLWGMITYSIPLERYPNTYNGQPLTYVALAAQKNHFSLYLTCLYTDPAESEWFRSEFERAGRKLDMGRSCVRFRKLEDLPLDVIGQAVAQTPPDRYIERYEAAKGLGGRSISRPGTGLPPCARRAGSP
jgi:hypothetical protein